MKDRVKAIGIPWTAEELKALQNGMTPEQVRAGILKSEDEVKIDDELSMLTKGVLADRARELGIEFSEREVTRGDLILEIKKAELK